VNVDGISIASGMLVPNADGIDVTSCSNVVVANCDIRAGDDAIAIVGYDHHFEIPGFSEIKHISQNILISNCNLQSYSSGIRIGFLDQNSVSNVQVNNVNITNSTRGIGIFVRDEGSLQHIHFSNMYIETKLRTGDMEGLTLDHITLQLENSPLNSVAGGNIDLRGCLDPKEQLFAADIAAFKIRYVDGLSMEHCKVNWDSAMTQPYFTNAVEVGHCTNIKLEDFSGTHAPSAPKGPATLFTNVTFRP
jgi:hypothetical protein